MAVSVATGILAADNAQVLIDTGLNTAFSATVTGAFSGTITFQVLYDATEGWVSAPCFTRAGVAATSTLTAAGNRFVNTAGAVSLRALMHPYTSGTPEVTFAGVPAISVASASGGGGGAATIADGADVTEGAIADAAVTGDNAGTVNAHLRGLTKVSGDPTDAGIITDIAGTEIGFLRGAIKQWITYLSRFPAALGTTTAANSLPVTLASDSTYATLTGAVTETAPATDTASSGGNGRLQRIAQRLTTLIGLLPAALVGGRLDVNLGAAPASLTIGTPGAGPYPSTGFAPAAPTATFTRGANTTAYTIGDEVGTAGTAPTTVSVARVNGGSGIIQGAQVIYSNNPTVTPQLVLIVLNATATLAGDNAQCALSDSDALKVVAVIPLSATQPLVYSAGAPTTTAALYLQGAPTRPAHFVCGGSEQTLYCFLITLNAFTPIANSEVLTVLLDIEQN